MGCDIHVHREKRQNGEWSTHDTWLDTDGEFYNKVHIYRNYALFGLLCQGVRRDIEGAFPEKGMPTDASPEVIKNDELWGADAHSHSYLTLAELLGVLGHKKGHVFLGITSRDIIELQPIVEDFIKQLFTQEEQEDPENYRIVFWFDN